MFSREEFTTKKKNAYNNEINILTEKIFLLILFKIHSMVYYIVTNAYKVFSINHPLGHIF